MARKVYIYTESTNLSSKVLKKTEITTSESTRVCNTPPAYVLNLHTHTHTHTYTQTHIYVGDNIVL